MQINNDQLNDLLRYLCSKDDTLQECETIEAELGLDNKLAHTLYTKLEVDKYITGFKTEEVGFTSIYLKPEGRAFISTGGYNDTSGSNTESYFEHVLIYLGHPDNRNKHFQWDDLLNELNVPKEFKNTIYNKLWFHPKLIDGKPTLKNPEIWVNQKGLEKVAELEDKYFMEHGTPLYPIYKKPLPLNEVCERLFQMHKNINYRVIWTKNTYKDEPENLNAAKEILIQKKIIYEKESNSGTKSTHLYPEFLNAKSYEEANKILAEAKKQLQSKSIHMGDGGVAIMDGQFRDLAFSPTTNPPTAPNIADTKQGKTNPIIRFILNNIVLVIILAVLGGLIVAYFTHLFGWN